MASKAVESGVVIDFIRCTNGLRQPGDARGLLLGGHRIRRGRSGRQIRRGPGRDPASECSCPIYRRAWPDAHGPAARLSPQESQQHRLACPQIWVSPRPDTARPIAGSLRSIRSCNAISLAASCRPLVHARCGSSFLIPACRVHPLDAPRACGDDGAFIIDILSRAVRWT